MVSPRVRKIADRIHEIVAEMLERRIKDPRLGFVTITDVRLTGDTQQATIFYTVLAGAAGEQSDEAALAATAAALESAKGLIRSEVAKQLGMRHAPTLEFVADALPESARHLDEVLAKARALDEEVAARRGAAYAGEEDPYKKPREVETRRGRPSTTRMTEPGLVVVDKPAGITSHDVVARVRRLAGTRKVGHAGTLDPMATGVLVVGVERATRLLGHLMLTDKAYDATVRLGVATTTDDAEGEVVSTASTARFDEATVRPRSPSSPATCSRCRPRSRRSRWTASAPTSGSATASRSSSRRGRSPCTSSWSTRSGPAATSSTSTSRCAAPAAPTSARSPATPAPGSVSAAT